MIRSMTMAVVAAVVLSSACAKPHSATATQHEGGGATLDGTCWTLATLDDTAPAGASAIMLNFDQGGVH